MVLLVLPPLLLQTMVLLLPPEVLQLHSQGDYVGHSQSVRFPQTIKWVLESFGAWLNTTWVNGHVPRGMRACMYEIITKK
jgi:hypothetical protein